MQDKIVFDRNSPAYQVDNVEYNKEFLRVTEAYLNEVLKSRGYVYLNQVYEELGVKWDHNRDNVCCVRRDDLDRLSLDLRAVFEKEGDFEMFVNIEW